MCNARWTVAPGAQSEAVCTSSCKLIANADTERAGTGRGASPGSQETERTEMLKKLPGWKRQVMAQREEEERQRAADAAAMAGLVRHHAGHHLRVGTASLGPLVS